MIRKTLTVTRQDGSTVVYNNVTHLKVTSTMLRITCFKQGAERTSEYGIKGYKEYSYV